MPRLFRFTATLLAVALGIAGLTLALYAWRLPPFTTSVEITDNAYVRGQVTIALFHAVTITVALFVFFANVLALLPGMPVATTSLNVTLGCAIVVFVCFNAYGLATNGFGYIKHLAGPAWYLAPLVFPIELIGLLVRPVTLAVRLFLNMSVDHLILGIFLGLISLLVPIPLMVLGVLIVLIQTLVFTLLTCIYIGLATEHEAH